VRKIVRVGDIEYDKPNLTRYRESNYWVKAELCGVDLPRAKDNFECPFGPDANAGSAGEMGAREINKFYCDLLGPRFLYRFQAANYHTWVSPHMSQETANLLRMTGRHWMQYNNRLVERAHIVLPHIQQAERDGLVNIIPIIVLFKKSPQEIRAQIGKGSWKRVANF
jgi:hypothetical protein